MATPQEMTISQLKNAIWEQSVCGGAYGPYSTEDYRNELEHRTEKRLGYHETADIHKQKATA